MRRGRRKAVKKLCGSRWADVVTDKIQRIREREESQVTLASQTWVTRRVVIHKQK